MKHLKNLLTSRALFFTSLLFAVFSIYMLLMPIKLGDTDMWYHLNGGKYFWDNLSIPTTNYFSFIEPTREWTNYFWGFQAIVYKLYDMAGYHGLAISRSILAIATLFMAFHILFKRTPRENTTLLLVLLAAFLIIFEGRAFQFRPHLFSYFLILIFIYILEFKPRYAPLLPLLTIPWANIHGVEWPVPALICGAYAIPAILNIHHKKSENIKQDFIYIGSLLLCAITFLINPYGLDLYTAPFNISPDTNTYIIELSSIDPRALSTIHINGLTFPIHTAMTVFFLISVMLLINGVFHKNIPIPAIIIFIGGCLLLLKGTRFIWEWLIMSIPLISHALSKPVKFPLKLSSESSRTITYSLLTIATAATLYEKSLEFGHYPFDRRGLPTGISEYVEKNNLQGKVLAPPNYAGYLEWKLYPKLKTFIDMQFPPSNDNDMFKMMQAYHNPEGIRKFVEEYKTEWALASLSNSATLKNIESYEAFKPVFMDDVLVLYANQELLPDFVKNNSLKHIDVHNLLKKPQKEAVEYIKELKASLAISNNISSINHILAALYQDQKDFENALTFAKKHAELSPENPNSHYLLATIYQELGEYEKARHNFHQSLDKVDDATRHIAQIGLASNYYLEKDFKSAYKYFKQGINPYKHIHSPEALYMYALSATITGELQQASKLLHMIIYSTTEENNAKVRKQANDLLVKIENGDFDVPSFFEWLLNLASGKNI